MIDEQLKLLKWKVGTTKLKLIITPHSLMKKLLLPFVVLFSLTACQLPRFNPSNYLLQSSDLIVQVSTESGSGTGTIVSHNDKVFVLTAGHVVSGDKEIEISLVNGQTYLPDSVNSVFDASNPAMFPNDLAVLDITDSWDHPLNGLQLASSKPSRGDSVHVVGYPLGIGGKDYQYKGYGEYTGKVGGFDTYTTPCAPGCSGAAILNSSDQVLGVLIRGSPVFPNLILAVPHGLMIKLIHKLFASM